MDRPLITFLTDFGPESAPAICRGVMLGIARDAQIVDISHLVRKFAVRDGAYLLWSALPWMPVGTHLAVVDPGVGTERRAIAIQTARGDVLVGPDNGLLMPAGEVLGGAIGARLLENRRLMLQSTTATFHGRDIFAPVAAHLAMGTPFEAVGPPVDVADLIQLRFPIPIRLPDGGLEAEVVYVDSFGNARLAATPADLEAVIGPLDTGQALRLEVGARAGAKSVTEEAAWGRTFGEHPVGAALVYRDSSGSLAVADNLGDFADRLGIESGSRVRLHSPRL